MDAAIAVPNNLVPRRETMRKLMILGALMTGLTFAGSADTAQAQYYSYGRSYYPSYGYRSYGYSPYRYGYSRSYSPGYYGYGGYGRGWNRGYYNRGYYGRGYGYGRGWGGGSGIYYRGNDFGIGIRF